MNAEFLNGRILVKTGDITDEVVDAIVNAANSSLLGGGGVDGAIHMNGGPEILKECRALRAAQYPDGLPTGQAVATTAGNLSARYVIHTVGPIYGEHRGKESGLLADCYRNSIRLAAELCVSTIAFPAISTGVYHFPKDKAAAVSAASIVDSLSSLDVISEVRLIFFSPGDARIFIENAGIA